MPNKTGKLFVVGLPIGNLGDITERAISILKEVDIVLCEDTRRTGELLKKFGFKKRLLSYHEHNEKERTREVIGFLLQGKNIALVSDAGMPCISDPGYRLVRSARMKNVEVVPVPGPSAITAALSVSGLPTDSFVFEGFLPKKRGKFLSKLKEISNEDRTVILFESVHRIEQTLNSLMDLIGDKEIFVAREMTKVHETYYFGRISDLLRTIVKKGEFVIVIPGRRFRENE